MTTGTATPMLTAAYVSTPGGGSGETSIHFHEWDGTVFINVLFSANGKHNNRELYTYAEP